MLKTRSCYLLLKSRRATTCTLPIEPPPTTFEAASSDTVAPASSGDHRSLCLSMTVQLAHRGLIDSSRQVIRRVIVGCSSVSDVASVVDFAIDGGIGLDSGCCSALIRRLTEIGQPGLAETFYRGNVIGNGIVPDSLILNSMIICLVKLGKFNEARAHLDRLIECGNVPSERDCNSILEELFKQDRFLEAVGYFSRFSEMGVSLRIQCCNRLFRGLCCQGHLDEAVELLDMLCERTGMPLPLNLYKSLFYGICRRGCAVEAEALFDQMETDGYFVDKVMYTCLMKEYCKDKNMTMATRVYLRMLKKGCELDHYVFNTLIWGFVRVGQFDKGWLMFNQMMEKALQPSVFTYYIMINAYSKEGSVDYALMLLENMVANNITPNVQCYTSLIAALYKKNRLHEADELYMSMLKSGIVPDHILFFTILKMFPEAHELELALMTLQAIVENGCGIEPSLILDDFRDTGAKIEFLLEHLAGRDVNLAAVGFAVVMAALCAQRNPSAALYYMDKMVSLGCRPLLFSYNSLLKCLCQDGLFKDAESLINLMQEQGLVPRQETYLIMVHEYCKKGDIDSAFNIVDQMEEMGLRPTIAIYDCIIGSLGRQGRVVEAEDVFIRMLESGIDPDGIAYLTMIHAFARNKKVNEAHGLFEKMVQHSVRPSSHTYTAMISGLVKANEIEKGCVYLNWMLGDGLFPNAVLFTSLIGHFFKKGDCIFSLRLIDLMDKNRIERDHVTYITLLSGIWRMMTGRERFIAISKESEKAKERLFQLLHRNPLLYESSLRPTSISITGVKRLALKLIEKVKEASLTPNLYLHNGIIYGFCQVGRMEDAYSHLESMQKEGLVPNLVTYTILMNGHIKTGDIDSAIGLFNKARSNLCAPDKFMYSTLLRGLCDAGRPIDALTLAYAMQKRGLYLNKVSHEKLLHCLLASNLTTPSLEIFKDKYACSKFLATLLQPQQVALHLLQREEFSFVS